nr:alpha/beta hydrolase [Skermania piniformis]
MAVREGGGNAPTPSSTELPPPAEPPAPKAEPAWRDCTTSTLDLYGLGAAPNGLTLECAELTVPVDAGGNGYGAFTAGVMRARLPQTPADAAPLVLTSGSDRPSTATLAGMAIGPATPVLAARPIVAFDRRGTGSSQAIECISAGTRRGLTENAQFSANGADRLDSIVKLSQDATTSCKDFLQPQEMTFDTTHAAEDLEQLRLVWQVDSIGLLGTGEGAQVALAYARMFPGHLSRLVLDAPQGIGDAQTLAEQRVQGAEAALDAFANRCAALNCALGPDPRAAITDLVRRAGAGGLGTVAANTVLSAISGFLGSPRADLPTRTTELADVLAAAGRGDGAGLDGLIQRQLAATMTDGQFVGRCTDGRQWPAPSQVQSLQTNWRDRYPVFGEQAALSLLACAAWPAPTGDTEPAQLNLPVLVLAGQADPVTGRTGVDSVTGELQRAGARTSVVDWQGWGHPVSAHSNCAQQAVVGYLKSGNLPENGTACPA